MIGLEEKPSTTTTTDYRGDRIAPIIAPPFRPSAFYHWLEVDGSKRCENGSQELERAGRCHLPARGLKNVQIRKSVPDPVGRRVDSTGGTTTRPKSGKDTALNGPKDYKMEG